MILPWNEFLAHDRPQVARNVIFSPYRFEKLQINDKEEDDVDDDEKPEVQQDLESTTDDGYSQITDSDYFDMQSENISRQGDFTPLVKKCKPKRVLFSDYCIHKFWCKKGRLCAYKHLAEEKEFFELCKTPQYRVLYKTKLCFYKNCKYSVEKSYLCRYAHSLEESRCLCCKGQGNGKHWMDQCPDNKFNLNRV